MSRKIAPGLRARLVLAAAATLLALALAELVVRVAAPQILEPHPRGLYVADRELGYALAPGFSGVWRAPEFVVDVSIDSLGLRERELPAKRPGEWRLLVLGDSYTFGQGVQSAEAFPQGVERDLHDTGLAGVTVINAGVPGYGTAQEAKLFPRLADALDVDAVLLGFFLGNDFRDNVGADRHGVVGGYLQSLRSGGEQLRPLARLGVPPELRVALRTHSHLFSLLMHAWDALKVRNDEGSELYDELPTPETLAAVDATRTALEALAAACRERGTPLGLVMLPTPTAPLLAARPGQHVERPGELLAELGRELGIPALDLTHAFRPGDYFPIDCHLTAQGHARAASLIASALVEGQLRSLRRG